MLIRTGDTVEVIAGNDRGQKSQVIKVDRTTGKAIVEGVNRVKKHIRRSQKYPQGGVLSKEMPVQLSNVKYVCPSCGKATRLGVASSTTAAKNDFARSAAQARARLHRPRRPIQLPPLPRKPNPRKRPRNSNSSVGALPTPPNHGQETKRRREKGQSDSAADSPAADALR